MRNVIYALVVGGALFVAGYHTHAIIHAPQDTKVYNGFLQAADGLKQCNETSAGLYAFSKQMLAERGVMPASCFEPSDTPKLSVKPRRLSSDGGPVVAQTWKDDPDTTTATLENKLEWSNSSYLTVTPELRAQWESWKPTPSANAFVLQSDSIPIITIQRDGTVEFRDGMTTDEASRAFWTYVAQHPSCKEQAQ